MKKPIIAVPGTSGTVTINSKIVQQTNSQYILESVRRAIVKAGGIPLMIAPNLDVDYTTTPTKDIPKLTDLDKKDLITQLNICDGMLIPGGVKWYEQDIFMCRYALNRNMPLLGICRGMQIMAATDNIEVGAYSKTNKKIETDISHFVLDTNDVHNVRVLKGTKLYDILGKENLVVNSRHNYGVDFTNQAVITSKSPDGVNESLEFPNLRFAIGVQWHPENLLDCTEQFDLMKSFVEESKKRF